VRQPAESQGLGRYLVACYHANTNSLPVWSQNFRPLCQHAQYSCVCMKAAIPWHLPDRTSARILAEQ
jgi:hypothetical protein